MTRGEGFKTGSNFIYNYLTRSNVQEYRKYILTNQMQNNMCKQYFICNTNVLACKWNITFLRLTILNYNWFICQLFLPPADSWPPFMCIHFVQATFIASNLVLVIVLMVTPFINAPSPPSYSSYLLMLPQSVTTQIYR